MMKKVFVLSLVVVLSRVRAETTNAPTPAQYALALLKPVADRLSTAQTFRFMTHSMVEVPSPTGQLLNYFNTADVTVGRPNKLAAKRTGDGRAFDLYCDGKTFTGVDEQAGFYAQMNAAGTFDEMIPQVMEKAGIVFPYADLLYSNVYGAVTKDLTHAYWVGKSDVDGIVCDHLAFAGPGVEWQIWIGPEKNPLPRRLAVTFLKMERQPRFLVNFTDWDLAPSASPKVFEPKLPAGAKKIAFKPIKGDK
ncbi:MAG: DUF2092 domain-containing protein [Verrucomicrobiota bacterium]